MAVLPVDDLSRFFSSICSWYEKSSFLPDLQYSNDFDGNRSKSDVLNKFKISRIYACSKEIDFVSIIKFWIFNR
jgi:hypothetical protein